MKDQKLKEIIDDVCKELKKESELFDINVNERSISHRLAVLLDKNCDFGKLDIDCEYNRIGNESTPKELPFIKVKKNVKFDDDKGTTVFPDIIIHKRGFKENLLVIEVKKITNRLNGKFEIIVGNDSRIVNSEEFDWEKLKLFTKVNGKFTYQLGVYILFDKEGNSTYKYFKNGEETDE